MLVNVTVAVGIISPEPPLAVCAAALLWATNYRAARPGATWRRGRGGRRGVLRGRLNAWRIIKACRGLIVS